MALRNKPNDIEAEKSVLGACFLSKTALEKAAEDLQPDSFYLDKHSKLFEVLTYLLESKIPVDLTTVTTEVKKKDILTEIGGVEYITELITFVPTAANAEYYIKIILDAAIRRGLIDKATEIVESGYNRDEDLSALIEEAEKKLGDISKNRKTSEFRTIKDVLYKTQKDLEKLSETKGEITGLATGWTDIDKVTSGLHANELIIVAARPAMGKTAFALNMAVHMATNNDKAVALFNLEMGAEQLATRMISSKGQIEGYKLRTGNLQNDDWKRVNEAIAQLADANLYIDDTPGITIGEIRAKCRRLANSKIGLSAVVIDYLQLITSGKQYGGNRQQEVSDISRILKTMAMEFKVPVIALAQLSRSVESREDKRPIMSDLRESGSIEQDADIVSFLYRDDYYNKEKINPNDKNTSITEYIIGKHRNGPTTTIELVFKKDTSTFGNFLKENKDA